MNALRKVLSILNEAFHSYRSIHLLSKTFPIILLAPTKFRADYFLTTLENKLSYNLVSIVHSSKSASHFNKYMNQIHE